MLLTAVGAFIGALLSLLASIFIEYQKKPKLHLTIEDPPADKNFVGEVKVARFLRVIIHNKPMAAVFQWIGRSAALNCTGEIQFYHLLDAAPVFAKSMPIRWANTEEPFSAQLQQDGKVGYLFDVGKFNLGFRRDCYPGSFELIDVAARFDDDSDCYGWSNESYVKGWRNPDWKLPAGRYFVRVTVNSAGEKIDGFFKLENSVTRENFRLIPVSLDESEKLSSTRS